MGYAAPIDASPFLTDRDGLPSDTVPRLRLGSRVHPLVSLALLQSWSCLRRPEMPLARKRAQLLSSAFHGVSLLFATSAQRVHSTTGNPKPVYVPPTAFLALPAGYSSLCLADLFHPAAASRIHAPGGSSPDLAGTTSSVARPFTPLAPSPCCRLPDNARTRRVDLKVLLQAGIRSTCRGV